MPTTTLSPSTLGRPARLLLAAGATAALVVLPTVPASAHVRVVPDDPTAGGWTVLTFRVPNESDTAGTTQVRVELPTDHPLASVSTQPVPGWTAAVERGPLPEPVDLHGTLVTEAPIAVTWTAEAGVEIGPGQFQQFAVSAGPLPDDAGVRLTFPTAQTYSDGDVVLWDEVADPGQEEPANPAPELTTAAAATDEAVGGEQPVAASTPTDGGTADTVARVGAGVAVLLGALALVLALRRGRVARAAR